MPPHCPTPRRDVLDAKLAIYSFLGQLLGRSSRTPIASYNPPSGSHQTRYCDATCQHDHWRRGHKQICKRIHRGGNAEQYYADKKYKEAVAVAVEKCADDTKGQTLSR